MDDMRSENQVRSQLKKKRRKQRVKRILTTLIILALVIAGLFLYSFYKQNDRFPWSEARAPISAVREVEAEVVESIFTTTIDLSGYVEPNDIQRVLLRASGTVTDVYVKEGQQVSKGDVLIAIDDTTQRYEVANLEANLEKIELTGGERDKELMEMQLTSARKRLDNTRAYANFDGVVASVDINVGDYFDAGATAMTIIDRQTLKATVEIDEIDMQYVELGQNAVLFFDSYPSASIEGYVDYIPMIGRYTNQGIGVMDVELKIPSPPPSIAPGYTFEGTITSEGETKILLLPQNAVTTTRGSSSVMKKQADGSSVRVPVTVKYLGEGMSQLLSGDLKAGDILIVRRTDTSNPFAAMTGGGGPMRVF
jgi:membrane fusion protein (multidrug efflux system)